MVIDRYVDGSTQLHGSTGLYDGIEVERGGRPSWIIFLGDTGLYSQVPGTGYRGH